MSLAFALFLRAAVLDMDAICAALQPGEHVDISGNRFERGDHDACSATNLKAERDWNNERNPANQDRVIGKVRP